MRKVFVLIMIFSISSIKLDAQTSKVIFYRGYKFTGAALHPDIYLSDTVVTNMNAKTFKVIQIPSKTIEFYSYVKSNFLMRENLMAKIKVNLMPNSIYFIKYSLEGYNDKIVPKFELLGVDELKKLSNDSYIKKKLVENNIQIEGVNINCSDTLFSISKKIKLVFNPSIWTFSNGSGRGEMQFTSHDNSLTGIVSESNSKVSENDVNNLIKSELSNYVVKTITYKRDTINKIPMIIAEAEAAYAGVNYRLVEYICTTNENTFMLMVLSKKNDFDTNRAKVEKLINGIMTY